MKRFPLLLVLVAAFALGAGAAKLACFPYVPDALNESCGKSVFEWNVMAARVDATPIPILTSAAVGGSPIQPKDFEIVRLEAEPRPSGLIVRAHLRLRDPQKAVASQGPEVPARTPRERGAAHVKREAKADAWEFVISEVAKVIKKEAGTRFAPVGAEHMYLLVHLDDRLVAAEHAGEQVVLGPGATRAEQLAALAQVLGATAKP